MPITHNLLKSCGWQLARPLPADRFLVAPSNQRDWQGSAFFQASCKSAGVPRASIVVKARSARHSGTPGLLLLQCQVSTLYSNRLHNADQSLQRRDRKTLFPFSFPPQQWFFRPRTFFGGPELRSSITEGVMSSVICRYVVGK